jgi:hypothetical protein
LDAGPLVAFVNSRDQHHRRCRRVLESVRGVLGTVWPAVTEAMFLLEKLPAGQEAVFEMLERRAVRVLALTEDDVPRIRELMRKYRNRPMDLADAALVRVAEREGLRRILTVDRKDFEVYRIHGRGRFEILP